MALLPITPRPLEKAFVNRLYLAMAEAHEDMNYVLALVQTELQDDPDLFGQVKARQIRLDKLLTKMENSLGSFGPGDGPWSFTCLK